MGTYQPDGRKKTDVSDSAEHERTITQFTSAQFTMHRNAIMRLLKDQCITPGGVRVVVVVNQPSMRELGSASPGSS